VATVTVRRSELLFYTLMFPGLVSRNFLYYGPVKIKNY